MTKACYEEYANHAMRFYVRNPTLKLNSPGLKKADIDNWNACNDVLRAFSAEDRAIIIGVYESKCTINSAVDAISAQLKISDGRVWQLISRASNEFAKRRGLA